MPFPDASAKDETPPEQRILVIARDRVFRAVARRACEIGYDGDCDECAPEGLSEQLLGPTPQLILVGADGLEDRGWAVVTRLRSVATMQDVPILAIGSSISVLDRWTLTAAHAFAVCLPAATSEVLATVIREALRYAHRTPDAAEPSAPTAQIHLAADRDGNLPIEAFLLLLAVTWQTGTLPELAFPALLNAAIENGHDVQALDAIEQACLRPIPLVDVDASELVELHRWYLYAFALWMSLGSGDTVPTYSNTVQVLGFTLGVSPRVRAVIQGLIEQHRRDGTDSRETFRLEDFRHTMLPELEYVAGQSMLPPAPPNPAVRAVHDADEDIIEMDDDAIVDDPLAANS